MTTFPKKTLYMGLLALPLEMQIGVLPEEVTPQSLEVSVHWKLRTAVYKDELDCAVCYAEVKQHIEELAKTPCHLLETFAHLIADLLLQTYANIASVTVEVKKLNIFQGKGVPYAKVEQCGL